MAVARLLFRAELGKGLSYVRKIKQRIVAKSIRASKLLLNDAFGSAFKQGESSPVTRGDDPADKSSRALTCRNALDLANELSVVGFVVGIGLRKMRLIGCVASGMNSGSAAEPIDF